MTRALQVWFTCASVLNVLNESIARTATHVQWDRTSGGAAAQDLHVY